MSAVWKLHLCDLDSSDANKVQFYFIFVLFLVDICTMILVAVSRISLLISIWLLLLLVVAVVVVICSSSFSFRSILLQYSKACFMCCAKRVLYFALQLQWIHDQLDERLCQFWSIWWYIRFDTFYLTLLKQQSHQYQQQRLLCLHLVCVCAMFLSSVWWPVFNRSILCRQHVSLSKHINAC